MIRSFSFLMLFLVGLAALTGCDSDPVEFDEYNPEPVLHAYMIAGDSFPEVHLQWVVKDITEPYDPAEHGIPGALIRIFPTEINSSAVTDTSGLAVYYEQVNPGTTDGAYRPINSTTVLPNTTYRIEAYKDGEVDVWAETTVPEAFTLTLNYPDLNALQDSIPADPQNFGAPWPTLTRNDPMIEMEWTSAFDNVNYGGAPQGSYFLYVTALTDTADLRPLDPDWDPNDPDDALETEQKQRVNFTFAPDYQLSSPLFWLFMEFEGPHRVNMVAASYEYYRYKFTQMMSNAQNPIPPESNIHGGFGCFGAAAEHVFYFNMAIAD